MGQRRLERSGDRAADSARTPVRSSSARSRTPGGRRAAAPRRRARAWTAPEPGLRPCGEPHAASPAAASRYARARPPVPASCRRSNARPRDDVVRPELRIAPRSPPACLRVPRRRSGAPGRRRSVSFHASYVRRVVVLSANLRRTIRPRRSTWRAPRPRRTAKPSRGPAAALPSRTRRASDSAVRRESSRRGRDSAKPARWSEVARRAVGQ